MLILSVPPPPLLLPLLSGFPIINKHLSMNKAKSLSLDDDNNNNNNGYLLCRSPRPVHDPRLVMVRELCTFVCNTNSDGSLTEISRLRINPIYHHSSFGFCNGICYGTITVSHPAPWNFCGTSYQWHFSKTRSPAYHTVRNAGIYLWNPSVRKHKRLPAVLDDDRLNYRSYGLAFPTSQNNDLKLLAFHLGVVVSSVVCETVGSPFGRVEVSPGLFCVSLEENMVGLMEMEQQFWKDIMRRKS